jgi:peptidoglycan/LPS O-acetylase OafA/YrhL
MASQAVSDATSDKIRILGFVLTLIIVFHSAFNLQMASGPVPAWIRYCEHFIHYGLRGLGVPFFFICSAYFLCARPSFSAAWPEEVRKRVKSLLLPFFLWSGLWVAAMWIMQSIPAIGSNLGRDRIDGFSDVVSLLTLNPIPHPLWYMRDLFLLTLLAPLIVRLLRTRAGTVAYFIPAAALWFSFQSILVKEAQDLFFFGVGAWLAIHRPVTPTISRPWKLVLAATSLTLFAYHCWWVETRAAENPFIFNAAILTGLPALWLCYDEFEQRIRTKRMLALSSYALFLYVAHEPLIAILRKAAIAAAGTGSTALFVIFACQTTIVICALMLAGWTLRNYSPWLYGTLVGGRAPKCLTNVAVRQPVRQEGAGAPAPAWLDAGR